MNRIAKAGNSHSTPKAVVAIAIASDVQPIPADAGSGSQGQDSRGFTVPRADEHMSQYVPDTKETVLSEIRDQAREPSMYKVLLLNDDYTTMEFVVQVLMGVFHKSVEDATRIMLNVHRRGVGVCGVYTYEVAETKSRGPFSRWRVSMNFHSNAQWKRNNI